MHDFSFTPHIPRTARLQPGYGPDGVTFSTSTNCKFMRTFPKVITINTKSIKLTYHKRACTN